jgi:hypothetical protein
MFVWKMKSVRDVHAVTLCRAALYMIGLVLDAYC